MYVSSWTRFNHVVTLIRGKMEILDEASYASINRPHVQRSSKKKMKLYAKTCGNIPHDSFNSNTLHTLIFMRILAKHINSSKETKIHTCVCSQPRYVHIRIDSHTSRDGIRTSLVLFFACK